MTDLRTIINSVIHILRTDMPDKDFVACTVLEAALDVRPTSAEDEDFRSLVKSKRSRDGLSQADLAKLLNVSPACIGQWERGDATPRMRKRADVIKKLLS